jgi:glycerol-3-phosphate dehydrogenase
MNDSIVDKLKKEIAGVSVGVKQEIVGRIVEVIHEETPLTQIATLSDPAHADDLEEWSPTALVCSNSSDANHLATVNLPT